MSLVLVSLALLAAAPARSEMPPPSEDCVTIIGTNDLHGVVEPQVLTVGDKQLRYGGMLALSGYLQTLRRRYGERLVLVDGGDLYQGTLISNLSEGRAIIAGYNILGYAASAIGNHEFDFGAGEAGGNDKLAVVKQRIAEAKFPFLALNVFERATHRRVEWKNTRPSVLRDAGGMKVGILGVSTIETPKVTRTENVTSLEFVDPVPHVIAGARQLRAEGARLVVLIGHVGGKCSDLVDPHDLSSCEPGAELFDLIERLPAGTIDVAVGGHTHAYVAQWVRGVATIEAGARGRSLGWVDACLGQNGRIDPKASKIYRPVTLCLDEWADGGCNARKNPPATRPATFFDQPVVPDPKLTEALSPYFAKVEKTNRAPLGVKLPGPLYRDEGSPGLGEVLCEATAKAASAPISIQNRGGLRADLPAGELTFGQVFEVLPFDNHVAVMEISGAELTKLVEHLAKRRSGVPPFVYGLEVASKGKSFELRLAGGKLVQPEQRYTVATSDFLAMGGEGIDELLPGLTAEHRRVSPTGMREALIAFLKERYPSP